MTGKGHDWIAVPEAACGLSEQLAGFPRLWKCSVCGWPTWTSSRPDGVTAGLPDCDESLVARVQDS